MDFVPSTTAPPRADRLRAAIEACFYTYLIWLAAVAYRLIAEDRHDWLLGLADVAWKGAFALVVRHAAQLGVELVVRRAAARG